MKTSLLGASLTKGSLRLGQQQHLMKAATEKHYAFIVKKDVRGCQEVKDGNSDG